MSSASPKISALEIAAAIKGNPPTPQQRSVIEADLAPALVIAGAGSGKTETMANRVLYLLANRLVTPGEVLGLTFTRKAAGELATRIRERIEQLAAIGMAAAEFAGVLNLDSYGSGNDPKYRIHLVKAVSA